MNRDSPNQIAETKTAHGTELVLNWRKAREDAEISLVGIFSKQHTKRHGALANVCINFPSICCRICLYNVFRFDRVQLNHLLAAGRNWPKPRQHFFVFWSVVRIFGEHLELF